MFSKEDLTKVYSLSCVENYFLAWLKCCGISDGMLYNNSFVSFKKVLTDFADGNAKYESYDSIERTMTSAKRYGLTEHAVHNSVDIVKIISALEKCSLVLIEVNDNFFKKYALRPWRADHFITITKVTETGYDYVNQFPLSEGKLTEQELQNCFAGKMLVYEIADNYCEEEYLSDEVMQFASIIFNEEEVVGFNCVADLRKLRDGIGIMRIVTRRLQSWLRFVASEKRFIYDEPIESFFDGYFRALDILYVLLEATVLRRKTSIDNLEKSILEIASYEKKLFDLVRIRRTIDEYRQNF